MAPRSQYGDVPNSSRQKKSKRTDNDESVPPKRRKSDQVHISPSRNLASQVPQVPLDGTSECRRSGRSGAGSGGRICQLQKIGVTLEAPTKKSRSATDLPVDTVENPLAPVMEKPRKGRGKKQSAPPLYSPPPASVPAPAFHQRDSESERFGFYQSSSQLPPIVPPGTEPDLQALNNPYIAAARKVTDSQPSRPPPRQQPMHMPRPLDREPSTSVTLEFPENRASESRPLSSHLNAFGTPAQFDDHQINPALLSLSNSQVRHTPRSVLRSTSNHSSNATETTNSEDENGSKSSADEEDEDGEDGEDDVGWGTTNQPPASHPGFSRERHSPNPIRHNSLPLEPDFDYSRDKADDEALHALRRVRHDTGDDGDDTQRQTHQISREGANARAELATRGGAVDILNRHHETNGRPSAPDPSRLATLSENATGSVVEPRSRAPRNSKKPKDSPVSPNTLAFYPATWKDFLEDAKRDCRIYHMLRNPFPAKSQDLKGSISESLCTTLAEWMRRQTRFDDGFWPERKLNMANILLADISTWRSELKTVALNAAPSIYGLIPPSDTQAREQWVKTRATEMLNESLFLRGGLDENGKTKNFAHTALQQAITDFFYLGSYRIADKRPDLFRESIPTPCLALVAAAHNCVLDGFARNGSSKSLPDFSAKCYSSIYTGLQSILDEVANHPYHGPRLERQRADWGKEAWAALKQIDSNVQRHQHLVVVLN